MPRKSQYFAGLFVLMTLLTTSRLTLTPITLDDAPFLLELLNTPGWVRYIGERNVRTIADAEYYIRTSPMQRFSEQGFGAYVCRLAESGTPIGLCTLIKRDNLPAPDIGFAFLPGYMGKGYAEEGTSALMEFAKNGLGLERLVAITVPHNSASIRLLEKLGLQYQSKTVDPKTAEELLVYSTVSTAQ